MMDGLAAAVWIGISALMVTAAWRVARAVDPAIGPFLRLLHASIIAWSILAGSALLLGMTGILVPPILEGLVIALSLVLHRSAPVLGRWASRTSSAGEPQANETPAGEGGSGTEPIYYLWAWGVLGVVYLARMIRYGILEYPSDWDTLNYHLPVIHSWMWSRSLYAPDCQEWFVPGTNEVIGLWLAAPFSGDFLVGLLNLPAAFVLALSVIELGRQVGLPTPVRHLAGLVAVTAEIVIQQTLTAKNDTAAAALFVAALAYAFRHTTEGRMTDSWLAATSLGLLMGVKYYAVGYSVVAGATWVLCRLMAAGWQAAAQAGIAGTVGGMAFGGYWYGRNMLVTGTPFYPKGYSAGTDVLSEWRPQGTWGTTLLGNGSPEIFPLLLEAIWKHAGPLHYLAVLLLPGALVWLVGGRWWLRQGNGHKDQRVVRSGLAVAIIGAGLCWGVIPFAVEIEPGSLSFIRGGYLPVRFGLCFLTISLIAVVTPVGDCWFLTRLTHARAALLTGAVSATGWHVYSVSVPRVTAGEPMGILLTTVLIGNVVLLTRELLRWITPAQRPLLATVGAIAGLALLCVPLSGHWHAHFTRHYTGVLFDTRIFLDLERLRPKKLYYLGYCAYPFAGSYRQTPVCRSLRISSESKFLMYLQYRDVTHVAVSTRSPDWLGHIDRIHGWIKRHSEVFRLASTGPTHLMYVIDRTVLAEQVARDQPSGIGGIDGPDD